MSGSDDKRTETRLLAFLGATPEPAAPKPSRRERRAAETAKKAADARAMIDPERWLVAGVRDRGYDD